ncbi:hypothetical protein ASPZODRAFT_59935 [Penicilliopsis zonata CBS 506.65]|uniref:Zn(2)-C6 fungal-type domain-containing protein n=1 Tax=Penicilliopsis zonata CBS 506.65 TaxID=1073090 RepID=A0A1L9SQB9_9EURO|nr:hypothetical protein ASPZODRAFT_59935 [Penicilliopsis zonata CBS 506.65]OJJ49326.1 hypothetical protein ASPZODRAFT_59935 [Penicilliopsis zonata CBS 506.65]
MTDPERRRRRPPVSCSLCRRRKIRCNRENPCNNCIKSGKSPCVYENCASLSHGQRIRPVPARDVGKAASPSRINDDSSASRASAVPTISLPSSLITSSASGSTATSQPSAQDAESMKNRIRQLEDQLAQVLSHGSTQSPASVSNSNIDTMASELYGTFHIQRESRGQPHAIISGVAHKTRLFGRSHWIQGIASAFRDVLAMTAKNLHGKSKASTGIQQCKSLARVIKKQRAPPWPTMPNVNLPPRAVADELIDCYIRTSETIYRVLHFPTFKRDYEALWRSETEPDMEFLVQLKLVFAIGATTYDDTFSLRTSAVHWIYEAHTWVSQPEFKARLNIQALQTSILLLFSREAVNVGGHLTWIEAGSLLRAAVSMGLHRDPIHLPESLNFAAEMRRRLWNTILEINIQFSLACGGPPFITLEDFDTRPPGNFDDEQLLAEDPSPRPETVFTQVSFARAFRETLPVRLTIVKFLNDLESQGSYEQTLRLDTQLRASFKAMYRVIHTYHSNMDPSSPSRFGIQVMDLMLQHYVSTLHAPFYGQSLNETAYAYTRKVVVDSSLKVWFTVQPSTGAMATQSRSNTAPLPLHKDLARLATCANGFYRLLSMKSAMLISMDLKAQLQEDDSLSPVPIRPDLLSVLYEAKDWALQCIEVGETNIKGYLFVCVAVTLIEALMRRTVKNEIPGLLVKAAEGAEEKCLPILRGMVSRDQAQDTSPGELLEKVSLEFPANEMMEDWDLLVSVV